MRKNPLGAQNNRISAEIILPTLRFFSGMTRFFPILPDFFAEWRRLPLFFSPVFHILFPKNRLTTSKLRVGGMKKAPEVNHFFSKRPDFFSLRPQKTCSQMPCATLSTDIFLPSPGKHPSPTPKIGVSKGTEITLEGKICH